MGLGLGQGRTNLAGTLGLSLSGFFMSSFARVLVAGGFISG